MQAFVLLALLTVLLLRQIFDPDIWSYLVVGREIVSTLKLPMQEFYLFPAIGEPAMFSALGYGLLHYAAYAMFGYPGMALVNALLVGGALTVLIAVTRSRERASTLEWPVMLLVLAGAYACLNFRTFYRPESTLYLCVALEILVLERWLEDGRNLRLLWLPVLAWLEAQLHTAGIVLVLVYGAYVYHWALAATWTSGSSTARQAALLIGIGAAMLALPILNPNGIEQLLLLVRAMGQQNEIVEYLPVWSTFHRWHFVALAVVAAAAWLLSPQRRAVDGALLLGFGWLAFRYNRNLGLFALVAVVPVGRWMLSQGTALSTAVGPWARRVIASGLIAASLAGLIGTTWFYGGWGVGIRPRAFPENAVDAIQHARSGGNVMNLYHLGGFLAFTLGARYQLAVDGHFVRPSFALEYHDRVMRADPDWEALLARFDVRVVVTPATLSFSGALIPLVERLAEHPRWRLVSVEDAGMVFVEQGLGAGLPDIDKREVWRQVRREASAVIVWFPDQQGAREALAVAERHLSASPPRR